MRYLIHRAAHSPELTADWNSPAWRDLPVLSIDQFHPRSSDHHPTTQAKLLFSDAALHVIFRVQDRYVKSVATQYQDNVCRDSCVELFIQPNPALGYFNFEFNCGGVMMLSYNQDPARVDCGSGKSQPVPHELGNLVRVATTMPKINPVEITVPIEWRLQATIPFTLFDPYIGVVQADGPSWRGNLFKCGSNISHPHWASWVNIGDELNFHQPGKFGELFSLSRSSCARMAVTPSNRTRSR